jgi:hypothetical protein
VADIKNNIVMPNVKRTNSKCNDLGKGGYLFLLGV